jgi:hypothetical protein
MKRFTVQTLLQSLAECPRFFNKEIASHPAKQFDWTFFFFEGINYVRSYRVPVLNIGPMINVTVGYTEDVASRRFPRSENQFAPPPRLPARGSGRKFRIMTNHIRTDHEVPLNICLVGLLPPFHGNCGMDVE